MSGRVRKVGAICSPHRLASLAMRIIETTGKLLRIVLVLGGLELGGTPRTQAAGFTYVGKDLLLGIRQEGGTAELVVNLGQITNYLSPSAPATIAITNLSTNQLNAAFANLNNLRWSVFACVRSNDE